ncbi:hypothetical protein [Chitinophaga sp. YIM B06452]|uniref:hypothetical protein n=1 Tax=Chitinophaga sp. YIM B06452 TaxID=3082158 RepID=UPI0031FEB833
MKQLVSFSLLFLALFTACSSSSDNNPDAVTAGTWRVSHFSERGNDETGDFSGYTFTFAGNGSASAVKQGVSKSGSWSLNSTSTRFSIDFGPKTDANKPLGELTDDWMVISLTDREIKLTDDNASSAEFLTFTKN